MERTPAFMGNPRTGSVLQISRLTVRDDASGSRGDSECVRVDNPRISRDVPDVLYHLGLSNIDRDLAKMFADVKFVCMGGSADRMESFANLLVKRGLAELPVGCKLAPVGKTERYSMFKVGPVICVNHGMGMASMSILLHELVKLLYHARASSDVVFCRIGTSGGLGLEGGTVVVATEAVNALDFQPEFTQISCGKVIKYNASFPEDIVDEVMELAKGCEKYNVPAIPCVKGKTMSTDDFYEGQARLDGALCSYDEKDREDWIKRAHEAGVRNIEMEGLMFGAFCKRAGVRALLCNTVLLNRLSGDQVTSTPEELAQFSLNSQEVVVRYIFKSLADEDDA